MVLTSKQRSELHGAIADYMRSNNFDSALAEFSKNAGLEDDASGKGTDLLEKKWTSVVRLQKKINDLEAKVEQLEEDLAQRGGKKGNKNSENLPKPIARHELSGFRGVVNDVRFHPTISMIAAAGEDGTVKVWDYESGEFERSLRGHTDSVQSIAFDPTGNIMASVSSDLSVKLWDFQTYECKKTLQGHEHTVSGVCFLPPNGDYLASCSRDNSIKIWETATGYCVKTLSGHDDWVRCIAASEDGKYLASGSSDHTIHIWESESGNNVVTLRDHTHVVETVRFAPEAACSNITVSLGATGVLGTGGGVAPEEGEPPKAWYLVSGGRDNTVKLWEILTQQCIHTFVGHDNWVRSATFHTSGKYILTSSDDKSIKVWSIELGRCAKTLSEAHPHFVTSVDFNKKFPMLASGGVDTKVKLWECS